MNGQTDYRHFNNEFNDYKTMNICHLAAFSMTTVKSSLLLLLIHFTDEILTDNSSVYLQNG